MDSKTTADVEEPTKDSKKKCSFAKEGSDEESIKAIDDDSSEEDLDKGTNLTAKEDIKECHAEKTLSEEGEAASASHQPALADVKKQNEVGEQNGNHQRLQTTDSPCLSTCTTATNLSSLGDFQSNSTINFQRKLNKEDNIRMAIPEIEPLQKKTEVEIEDEPSEAVSFKKIFKQLLAAVAVSWVSMIIGYSSAYTSPAEHSLENDFGLDKVKMSWISSFMPLGALCGGLFGGTLIEHMGRKWTILLTNVMFLVAWLTIFMAQNYVYLYIGRIITGVSVGITSLTLPVYLAETLQPEVRGSLGLLPTALGNVGILLCYLFGAFYEWKMLALIGAILAVPFLVLIWFIPETPRFLVYRGNEEESRKALQWLRGADTDIEKEFHELKKNQQDADDSNESVMELFNRNNIKLLAIVLGLMFFQQFSGINAVIFYTTRIFKESGSSLNENICTTIVGTVNFISTFIAAVLIDRFGRKVLLYISSVSMLLSLTTLGTYFYLKIETDIDTLQFGWLPLVSFMVYVLGFSLGFGPIPWLMMGEILPARIRGPAASISTSFNWSSTFIITKTFLLIIEAIGLYYTFWMFAVIVLGSLIFSIFCVPETRGKSLADIERQLTGGTRKVSSVANLKPTPSTC
ncbi:unnamed protein product [Acanthoscelides obtectus]|uniref:Major facilitator superfamily (MFS) profile domain-containing protein n=2 Tax=Acanthoscelides obtectus TaxID=200917 RepID=A0A9P0L2V9_ACAOB|nr:unnamed protein product [Acanthoscelides obtectus]CAK1627808.1 Facilitated trehalose transporter Tret1 [Acanthoscelides obtectus]